MNRQLASRNAMVDWQVAPTEYEINNFDEPKFRYRKYVEEMIHALPKKNVRKKTFVTISTNVLCADVDSKNPSNDPIDRDLYQPLEIALTKWSAADYSKPRAERSLTTKTWIINPGRPLKVLDAKDHKDKKHHNIEWDKFSGPGRDPYVEYDLKKIVSEINSLLTADRTVFSDSLRHCRQDLGCLKWLNQQGKAMKPIKVYSAEDLFVVLLRYLSPHCKDTVCKGVARYCFDSGTNLYESALQCDYHRDLIIEDEDLACGCCAKLIAESWAHVIMDQMGTVLVLGDELIDAMNNLAVNDPGPARRA